MSGWSASYGYGWGSVRRGVGSGEREVSLRSSFLFAMERDEET